MKMNNNNLNNNNNNNFIINHATKQARTNI